MPSGVLPDALGTAAVGGKEGRESGTVRTSGRGGAGLQTAESNGCIVKKWDRERRKVGTLPARPDRERSQVSSAKRGTKRDRARARGPAATKREFC